MGWLELGLRRQWCILCPQLNSAQCQASQTGPGCAALQPYTMGRRRRCGRCGDSERERAGGVGGLEGEEAGASKRQSPWAACARKSSSLSSWGKGGSLRYTPLWAVLCRNTVPFSQGTEALPGDWGGRRGSGPNQPTLTGRVVSGQRRTSDMAPSLCSSLS